MRLIDHFDRGADLYSDRHCLHDGTRGWTYKDVRAQTHRVANGLLDEDGFVYIVDRKKDMIISGGFNVFPTEVEQVRWSRPGVRDCPVTGVPDKKSGEAVKAVVERKPGAAATADELIHLAKD